MRITKYGQYTGTIDGPADAPTLTLDGPKLYAVPEGPVEMWIAGKGTKKATGINGNTWLVKDADGRWYVRERGNDQRGQYRVAGGKWMTKVRPATQHEAAQIEATTARG